MRDRPRVMRRGALVALGAAVTACYGGPAPGPSSPPALKLASATVFDHEGEEQRCEAPKRQCPPETIRRRFLDQCTLRGYRVQRCGCERLCTGNVAALDRHYSPDGEAKACTPVDNECTPKDVSAAFQDACTDRGHQLVACGCEWLCSGPTSPS